MIVRKLKWHDLSDKQKLEAVEKIFSDSNFDVRKLEFEVHVKNENDLTLKELEDVMQTFLTTGDLKKAKQIKEFMDAKRQMMN